jgi:hypothetical protein
VIILFILFMFGLAVVIVHGIKEFREDQRRDREYFTVDPSRWDRPD